MSYLESDRWFKRSSSTELIYSRSWYKCCQKTFLIAHNDGCWSNVESGTNVRVRISFSGWQMTLEIFVEDTEKSVWHPIKEYKGISIKSDLGHGNRVWGGRIKIERRCFCFFLSLELIHLHSSKYQGETWNLLPVVCDRLWHEGCPYQSWLTSTVSLQWVTQLFNSWESALSIVQKAWGKQYQLPTVFHPRWSNT